MCSFLKNAIIGSNKQKHSVIEREFVPRLLGVLKENTGDPAKEELLLETTACLTSLAKGTEDHVRYLVNAGCIPIFIGIVLDNRSSPKYIEMTLKALRSIYNTNSVLVEPINTFDRTNKLVLRLLQLATPEQSFSNQECVALILSRSCQSCPDNQRLFCTSGGVDTIGSMLASPCYKVQLAALDWLAHMCYQSEFVANVVVKTMCGQSTIPEVLTRMMAQDLQVQMQLFAAKCMTYLYRSGAICPEDKRIVYKTLPTLIRICKNEKEPQLRALAADYLAYLTQVDTFLQQTASNCDHIIPSLANMLKFQSPSLPIPTVPFASHQAIAIGHMIPSAIKKLEHEAKLAQEMKQAAFKAFASLGANDEDIRKKIIETDMLMDHIVNGLSDPNDKTRLAALTCLHSLSRSVQQLKTTFQDHAVWIPLRNLLHNASDDVLLVASSTICNLLLEFSNSKQHFTDRPSMELLCGLTRREDSALRLNGVWALMNMAYQSEQSIKMQILSTLTTEQIFRLLSDRDPDVVIKTLGLLRNLLANKPHIDHIMTLHGREIVDALLALLDSSESSAEVREQVICIFANIASGETSRDCKLIELESICVTQHLYAVIMTRRDILKRLADYMKDENVKLQIAATYCVSNLAWAEEEGAQERQQLLRELNVHNILQQLLSTPDTALFDKVKTALQQFNN